VLLELPSLLSSMSPTQGHIPCVVPSWGPELQAALPSHLLHG